MGSLDIPFQGAMPCMFCHAASHGPAFCGGWRAVDADRRLRVYICPQCLPFPDESSEAWGKVYYAAMKRLYAMNRHKPIGLITIWRETKEGPVNESEYNAKK